MCKKTIPALMALFITLMSSCNGNSGTVFRYCQGSKEDFQARFYYSDDYFRKDSTIYDSSLSTCSLSFAMASFASNRNGADNNYNRRYRNGEDFLSKNGFKDIDVNAYYKKKPETDSLGVIFGHKTIDGITMVASGIRGANYESEWASNFTLGDGTTTKQAQGFYEASTIYLDSLKDYLNKYSIQGSIKLWTVGYSRAGASNNLASGRIDQQMEKNGYVFSPSIQIQKENLYSYCFEPPQGASFEEEISPRDDIYSNIHNIVNDNDPVPKVAMSFFGYTRYGVDYYLPDSYRDLDYKTHLSKVLEYYNRMDNFSNLGEYIISDFTPAQSSSLPNENASKINWTSGLFLQDFLNDLSELGVMNLSNYVENFQGGLRHIFSLVYRNGVPKTSMISVGIALAKHMLEASNPDQLVNDLLHDSVNGINQVLLILHKTLDELDIDVDYQTLKTSVFHLLQAISKTILKHPYYLMTMINLNNVKAFGAAHYPELCLAHLMAQDRNYNSDPFAYDSSGSYHYLTAYLPFLTGDISLLIKDEKGNILGGFENGELIQDTKFSCCIDGYQLRIYFPGNGDYRITSANLDYSLYSFSQKARNLSLLHESSEDETYDIKKQGQ